MHVVFSPIFICFTRNTFTPVRRSVNVGGRNTFNFNKIYFISFLRYNIYLAPLFCIVPIQNGKAMFHEELHSHRFSYFSYFLFFGSKNFWHNILLFHVKHITNFYVFYKNTFTLKLIYITLLLKDK